MGAALLKQEEDAKRVINSKKARVEEEIEEKDKDMYKEDKEEEGSSDLFSVLQDSRIVLSLIKSILKNNKVL